MQTLRYSFKAAQIVTSRTVLTPRSKSAPIVPYRNLASAARKTAEGKVHCACARHPWPVEEAAVECKIEHKRVDCSFDFRKLEVNPFDPSCDCKDPPPAAGCRDLGRPKNVCCRSIRKFGCYCEEEEEEEESCEEESEEEEGEKMCDLDFRKLEVNPYDDSCECIDGPPPHSCASLADKRKVCCHSIRPFGCPCDAYDEPGLECLKPKPHKDVRKKKECNKKDYKAKCL